MGAFIFLIQTCVIGRTAPLPSSVLWRWDGELRYPSHPIACSTPLVAQLTDDDGDGDIDGDDNPDVLFLHQRDTGFSDAVLTAVDGSTGGVHFDLEDPEFRNGLAVGDIDGDGLVEILVMGSTPRIIALEHDGTLKWRSDILLGVSAAEGYPLGIADLDQDGTPEVFHGPFVVSGIDGRLKWKGLGGTGGVGSYKLSIAADLDPVSPGMELLAWNSLYASDGRILWQNTADRDWWTGIGDLDGDSAPEIVVMGSLTRIYDRLGNLLGPSLPRGDVPQSPIVADLDGDGMKEVVVIGLTNIEAFRWSISGASNMWSVPTAGGTGGCPAVAFDFQNDGSAEVVFHDVDSLYVLDGATGAVLFQEGLPSGTGIETPVIADIDDDCEAEIIVGSCGSIGSGENSVIAYNVIDSGAARAIWNQYGYHVVNINDDGTIPRMEQPAATWSMGWSEQVLRTGAGGPTADPGPAPTVCAGLTARLDASGSRACDSAGLSYRWLEGATVVPGCDWSASPSCDVAPSIPTAYTLEVSCLGSAATCITSDSAMVVVDVIADVVPADIGNSLRGVRAGLDVAFSWGSIPNATTYNLYRGVAKGAWPPLPAVVGLNVTAVLLPDVPAPPNGPLYFYRVAGASCSGLEGP